MRPVPQPAIDLCKRFEQGPAGGPALRVYADPAGIPTIGWGHKLLPGDPTSLTADQADALLLTDLQQRSDALYLNLTAPVAMALNDNQWAALLDFVFNLGIGTFGGATLRHFIVNGDYASAADEFPKWVYSGHPPVKLAGLVTRRGAERALFIA